MSKKHKPQSRINYEISHPNWTVRLTEYLFNALQVFLENSGISRRDFIAIALGKLKMNFDSIKTQWYNMGYVEGKKQGYEAGSGEGYNNGWNQGFAAGEKKGQDKGYDEGHEDGLTEGKKNGYDEGVEETYERMERRYKIWYFCSVCGELIIILPNSNVHHFIIDMLRFHGWKNHNCPVRGNIY